MKFEEFKTLKEASIIPETENKQGGFDPKTPEQKKKWKKVDLITLPKDVEGTNCFNCKHIVKKDDEVGFCTHKDILDWVTKNMCCAVWDNDKVIRKF